MNPEQPRTPGPSPTPEHRDEGLDLARSVTRATTGAAPPAARRKRRGGRGARRIPPTTSGAHPDDRDPQLLDTSVARLVNDRGWEIDLRIQAVFGRWTELVGAEVGAHSTPESLTDGKLSVRTDSTAWATQLKYLAPTVVRRLNEELGDGIVTVIDILGPQAPSWKKGLRSVRGGRGPRDTYG